MKRFYKKIVAALPLGSLLLLASSQTVHAGVISTLANLYNFGSSPNTSVITFISYLVNSFLNLFVSLGGWLINVGLNLSNAVFNSPTVQTGFSLSLSIANLGFVLGIIIIAIATILRSETYGVKQILWKLIVMAILVNFGLVVTGPIVGLADNFAGYFLNASGGASNFALNITTAFSTSGFQQNPTLTSTSLANGTSPCAKLTDPAAQAQCQTAAGLIKNADNTGSNDFLINTSSALFSAIFIGITAFTLILIGLLLIVRYIYLSILLILLPLAWLTWIFPKMNYWSKWWGLFLKWTMFPAITLFFLYLAILSVTTMGNGQVTAPNAQLPASANPVNSPATAIMTQTGNPSFPYLALNEIVAIGLCLGGLYAANSMSLTGSEAIMHGAKWAGGQVRGYVGRKTKAGGRIVGDRIRSAGKEYNPETKQTTTALQRFGSRLQGVPVLRGAGAALANKTAPTALHEERKENIKDYVDGNLKSLTNEGILKRATSNKFIDPTISAAIAQELARRNLTDQLNPDPLKNKNLMDKYVAEADRMGNLEAVTSNRPDLMPPRKKASGAMETPEEATARAVASAKGEIFQANPEIFNATHPDDAAKKLGPHIKLNPGVLESAVLALNTAQMGILGSDTTSGNEERKNNITESIKNLVDRLGLKKEIEKTENRQVFEKDKDGKVHPKLDPKTGEQIFNVVTVKTGKYELDKKALDAAIATRPELKGLDNIVKHMESSSNWASALN